MPHRLKLLESLSYFVIIMILLPFLSNYATIFFEHPYPSSSDLGWHLFFAISFEKKYINYVLSLAWYPIMFHSFIIFFYLAFRDPLLSTKVSIFLAWLLLVFPFYLLTKVIQEKPSMSNSFIFFYSILFLFNECFSEMLAWGGGPNFLGFVFSLSAFYFYLKLFRDYSNRDLYLLGLSVSLIAWSHPPTLFYFIIWFLYASLLLLVSSSNKFFYFKIFAKTTFVTLFFSLLAVPIYYRITITRLIGIGTNRILPSNTTFSSDFISVLYLFCNFLSSSWLIFRYTFYLLMIMFPFVVIGFYYYYHEHSLHERSFIVSLFLSPLTILLLMCFKIVWLFDIERVTYYLTIPYVLLFGYGFSSVFKRVKKRYVRAGLVIFLVIFTGVYVYQSSQKLCVALDYYSVLNDDLIDAYDWLEAHVSPSDLIVSGVYSWGVWLKALKDLNVSISSYFLWGHYWLLSPYFRVSEYYPFGKGNPEIAFRVFTSNKFKELFFVDHAFVESYFSPQYNTSMVQHLVLGRAPFKFFTIFGDSGWFALRESGWVNSTLIRRTVIAYDTARYVDLVFEGFFNDSVPRSFSFWIWGSYGRKFTDISVRGHNVSLTVSILGTSQSFPARLTVEELVGDFVSFEVVEAHPSYKIPGIHYVLNTTDNYVKIRVRVWNLAEYPALKYGRVVFWDTVRYLYEINATYILMSNAYVRDITRLVYFGFDIVYERADILILKKR